MHAAHQLIDFQAGHERQCQLRAHAVKPDELAEQLALALFGKTIEQVGVFAHDQMGVHGDGFAHLGQTVQRGHGNFQFVTHAVDVDNQVRRLFLRQGAAQTSNHVPILPLGEPVKDRSTLSANATGERITRTKCVSAHEAPTDASARRAAAPWPGHGAPGWNGCGRGTTRWPKHRRRRSAAFASVSAGA